MSQINCTHTRARDARARRQKQPSRLRGRTLVCLRYHPAHPHRANNPRGGGSHPTPTRSRHAIATRSSVRACGSRPDSSRSRHAIATRSSVRARGSRPNPSRSRHAIATRSSVRARGSRPGADPSRSRHAIATRSLVSRQVSKVHHRSQHPWPLPHARGFKQ